ncbi:SUN domain-containing ossification factor isoform X2 [Arapaima gigas]
MKRLCVVSLCLVVALLCWYPSHVCCSEKASSGPILFAQDEIPEPKQGSDDKQVEEEWATHAKLSYDVGLEAERTLLEQMPTHDCREDKDRDQTVKSTEPPVSTKPEPVTDAEPQTEPQLESEPSSSQEQALLATATSATPAAVSEAPDLASDLAPEDILSTPTSYITTPSIPSSAIGAPTADPPVGSSVDAVQSTPDCEVTGRPVALSPSDPPPFGSKSDSLSVDHMENASSTQGHGKGTKTDLNILTHVDQSLPGLNQGEVSSQRPQEENLPADVPVVKEMDPSVPSKEDIPTFDEWKKKVMEVEKEKSQSLHTSSGGSPHTVKKVQKNFNNYASVECGAKILSANTEAKSTSAILMENMDLYMLNPCSTKIWFVIELCEPIQVKQLDIANFELFSSTPKDFLVSISDRYPTSKWIKLGTFHARDERTVQSFPLDEQLYAKYVKVELISHFGSEHFCPLSLIRVFGTSMVEEYEEIAEPQYASERVEYLDEDYGKSTKYYPPGYVPMEDKSSKNLLGSATNAILNMVNNIAANVLGATQEPENGADGEANFSIESENVTATSIDSELRLSPSPTPSFPSGPDTTEWDPSANEDVVELKVPTTESPTPALPEESRIVTLVLEEEEEPSQSTITLLEEEDEPEDEPKEQDSNPQQQESLNQCGELFALSCVATLQEYLHHYCSIAVARQRVRIGHQKGRRARASTHSIPAQSTVLTPSSKQQLPFYVEKDMETGQPLLQGEEVIAVESTSGSSFHLAKEDVVLVPEPSLLEPSQTASFPHFSFSDASLSTVIPTEQIPEPVSGAEDDISVQLLDSDPEMQLDRKSPATSIVSSSSPGSVVEHPGVKTVLKQQDSPLHTTLEQSLPPLPTATQAADAPPPSELPVLLPETDAEKLVSEEPLKASPVVEDSEAPSLHLELKVEEPIEDNGLSMTPGSVPRTATDFYAELQNSSELSYSNGNQVHGSSQKESVFMRLNNRIKALEMNMSLSSRYLEELSQRYRKQMEEMQRAFNKTIIKLQNTSRIAEEQDQRQTESIQALQSQLENVTQLMLNLSLTVSQLQNEVSDRQSYLVVSLVLCLSLGLLLCIHCCRGPALPPPNSSCSLPKSNHYPSPKRCFSSYDDMSLKRRISCPLVRSKSFQFPPAEGKLGPDDLYIVEPLRFSPQKKKKRCKMKGEKVEMVKPSAPALLVANGGPKCNGAPMPPGEVCLPPSKDPVSEGSSEGSSLSDEPLSSSQPVTTRMDKKAFKQRRSRLGEQGRSARELLPTLEDIMKGSKNMGIGTFGVTAVSGQV